jgi:hypothetical protein
MSRSPKNIWQSFFKGLSGTRRTSGKQQFLFLGALFLCVALLSFADAVDTEMKKSFKPTKNLLGVKTKLENVDYFSRGLSWEMNREPTTPS